MTNHQIKNYTFLNQSTTLGTRKMAEHKSPPMDASQLAKYIVDTVIEKDRKRNEVNEPSSNSDSDDTK